MNQRRKGFTLIELIVVMAVIGVLVLLAMPKFIGYTQKANLTEIKSNSKQLENASERYYMDTQQWPKLSETAYTAEQIKTFANEIKNKTGAIVTLDPAGKYYDIDYDKLQKYVQEPKDSIKYIIQNPVGEVYYLEGLTVIGQERLDPNAKPQAVISYTPSTNITKSTNISWSYSSSTDADGDSIVEAQWQLDNNPVTSNPNGTIPIVGNHVMKLRVKDSRNLWSDWTETIITVKDVPIVFTPSSGQTSSYMMVTWTGNLAGKTIEMDVSAYGYFNNTKGNISGSGVNISFSKDVGRHIERFVVPSSSTSLTLYSTDGGTFYLYGIKVLP